LQEAKQQELKEEQKKDLTKIRESDDEQKKQRFSGIVKWYNGVKGYGFIKRDDEEKDIFVHFSAIKNSGLKQLKEGEQFTFEVSNSEKGPSAVNLEKIVDEVFHSHLKVVK
jgi:CspA family cold shock protein